MTKTSDLTTSANPHTAAARRVANVLDNRMVDPIIGFLVPGLGDVVSSAAGLYVVGIAIRHGTRKIVIARMLLNLAIDALVGIVPILGDVFDVVFRAHHRNLVLLERRAPDAPSRWIDWLVVGGAGLAFTAAMLSPVFAFIFFLKWVF